MNYKEEAIEIYEAMEVYDWDEVLGYMPNDKRTKKKCHYMIEAIMRHTDDLSYWQLVLNEINKL